MSDTNPYAAKTDEETVIAPSPIEILVDGIDEPEDLTVPEGTIAEVLAWVGESVARAELALKAEEAGQNRKMLVRQLRSMAL